MISWSVVYKKAYNDDGSLFFPEKLSQEFLDSTRKTQGSYLFANQYLNEVFPTDEQIFKPSWIRYYNQVPTHVHNFAFIDPAISTEDGADYTALTVISVDSNKDWYLRVASRERMTPTEIIKMCFRIHWDWKPKAIGIESNAYQEALLYMLDDEMKRMGVVIPVTGIKTGTDMTKEMRIMGLVPRMEWGRILFAQGLHDLEQEMMQFPRGSHDDLLDSLSQQETIVYYPTTEVPLDNSANPHSPDYERKIIEGLIQRANQTEQD